MDKCKTCEWWETLKDWENILCYFEQDPRGRCTNMPKTVFKRPDDSCSQYKKRRK